MVAEDEGFLARLDRMLWDQGPTSFLPHGLAGGPDDARQPILLSTSPDAPNLARNILIADGIWRDAALSYDRASSCSTIRRSKARAWPGSCLPGREGVERRYWAREGGEWVQKA